MLQAVDDSDKEAYAMLDCGCGEHCEIDLPPGAVLGRADRLRVLSDKSRHQACYDELMALVDIDASTKSLPMSERRYIVVLKWVNLRKNRISEYTGPTDS